MRDRFDIVVVGAGPAGSSAARTAAQAGARVLLIESRPVIGRPVQCAEYVAAQIRQYVPLPPHCIACRVRALRTHLPDGEMVETPAAGYVLERTLFDKSLAVAAHRAGAEIWVAARAIARTDRGLLIRREGREREVECTVIIGADGPRSTVARWVRSESVPMLDALQVEVVLPTPRDFTAVYFDPLYVGGYGWLFPKGETANVGVGVNRALGGDPRSALEHLLDRLQIPVGAVVGRTGGPVPVGGPVAHPRVGTILLVGDAAGHTHPITGAGIFTAVVGGTLAGRAAARGALDEYEREWEAFPAGPLRHARQKRLALEAGWRDDPAALSDLLRETWVAFRGYGRRGERRIRSSDRERR